MAMFCLLPKQVEKLKNSALSSNVNIAKLYTMTSEQRRNFFAKDTDVELGKFLNTEFEKAIVSNNKEAFLNFAKSVYAPTSRTKPVYKNLVDKINGLDELGVLTPEAERGFMEDLVSDKLGVSVTPDEVVFIQESAKKIAAAQRKLGENLGNPQNLEDNIEFFAAKKKMDNFLMSHNPAPKLRVLTGTIGRGMMLASIKSPILNIGSNIEVGVTEAISRRIAGLNTKTTDNKLAKDYIKMVWEVYQKTGYDLSRMTSLEDGGVSGGRVLDDIVHSQGKGAIRKTGQIVEDIVFKQLMGAPDALSGAIHFADSVNISAIKISKGNKIQAVELMNDAMRIEPQTIEGQILRDQAILDAQVATWTNDSWATKTTQGIRTILNDLSGDFRAGDFLLPFVKTGSNVIATGADYAGLGVLKSAVRTVKAIRSGELLDPEVIAATSRDMTRAGMGTVLALIIASNLDDDDYVGAYDPARTQIESLKNSTSNSFRVGNKWISTDWLGPLSVPFNAMMYAKKYSKTAPDAAFQYGQGIVSSLTTLPGVEDVTKWAIDMSRSKPETIEEAGSALGNSILSQAASRLVPSILSDMAKVFDQNERVVGKGDSIDSFKRMIPGLRNTLPVKKNIFGEDIKTEPGISTILFGSRVKTSKEEPIIAELDRVSKELGKSINLTDWDKTTSKTIAQFRQKKGNEIFEKAKIKYGNEMRNKLESIINNERYNRLDDDSKYKILSSVDADAQEKTLKSYGFKYKKGAVKKLQ